MVVRSLLAPWELVAKLRRLSGRAEEVVYPEAVVPWEGLERSVRVGAAGSCDGGGPRVEVGRWSRFHASSQALWRTFLWARRSSQSRAFLRWAFSSAARSMRKRTASATPRRQAARFEASVVSMSALSEKTVEKYPEKSVLAVATQPVRDE